MGSSASSSASGSESDEENSDFDTQVCENKPVQVTHPAESDNLGDIDLNQLFDHVTLRDAASKIRDDVPETVVQQHHGHLVRWLEERYQRNEETISLTQFCDVLMNRGVSREECTIAFDQFDVDGEGQAYVESMLDALRSSNGANLRGELSHAIRILTACTLTPGLIDVFSSDRESVGQHGQRILKYLLRNRAPSSALPYPSLDGFTHTTTMRLSVLDQHLQEKQRQSAFRDSFEMEGGGEVKLTTKCFKSFQVSTNPRDASRLTDGDPSTYWQSDGPAHTHWVRFKLRPGVCLKHLSIQVARGDHSYMPQHVTVLTGHSPVSLQEVTEVRIASHITGDVTLLENAKVIRPYVQISIKRCQFEGCDVRVHGIRALGYKMVQKSDVSVKDASAMWYLSVLASTANAAIPLAPHLRSAILSHTKMALSHMPPLSLMPQQLSKASFLSPHVLDQVAEFLHNIARNESGEMEMEGLKILLEFALARGNLASILKALQDLLDHKNSEIEGAVKMLRNLNTVRDSILKKHGTQLTVSLEGCDGGQQDETTAPGNVLCGNWSAKGYVSNSPKVNMFFTKDTPFQITKVQIKVAKGATGPKCGLIFVYNDQKGFDLKRHLAIFEKYDSWNSSDYRLFQGLRAASICGKPDNPVAYFSLDNDWDEVEVPLDQCFVGQYALIKFLGPRGDTATRLGVVGVQFYGFSRTSSVLDNVDISSVAPLPYDVYAPINTMVLFTQVISFIVRICQDLEVMKKRKEGTVARIPVPDMQHLTLNIISQLYNAIPQEDNQWVYARILCLNLLHISIPNLAKHREKETAKARMLSNLQLQDHPKLGQFQLHGAQIQETRSDNQPAADDQTSQDRPMQETSENTQPENMTDAHQGTSGNTPPTGQLTTQDQQSQEMNQAAGTNSMSGPTPTATPTSVTPPPMTISGTSSPMSETRELDTSVDQRQARELFNHLCQLASFDGGDGSQEDPKMLLKVAAEGCILDGAAVFFPGKEARREELFNMMNSMVTGEDTAVGLVFQSLCRFFSTVDPSGLLELPSSSQEDFNQGSVLMVFDTLLSASYKEFAELIEDREEGSPLPSGPSHVCSLLCALQTSLLGWAKHCLTDSKGDSKLKKTAGEVIRDYCGMQCSWARNALCLLQRQKGVNNRLNDLIHTFIPTAFRQLVLCVTLLCEMELPYVQLAQRLLSVAVEIRELETKLNIHFQKDGSPVQGSAKEEVVILRKWHIESAHNYDNNQHVTQIFTCPGADLFEVTFDPKCETERRYDYLEFTDSKGVKTRYDQKVGTDKWPTNVTFNSGQRLQFLFHSDSSNNFWGYSFDVIAKGKPDVSLPWLYDLQLGLAKLIGTLCSQILSLKAEKQMREEIWESDEQKRKSREALSSQNFFQTLFRGGHNVGKPLRSLSGEKSLVAMGSRVHKFLVMVAEGTEELTTDKPSSNDDDNPDDDLKVDEEDVVLSKAVDDFLHECREKGQTPNMGGPVITRTVQAVFAALLWHSGSLREYIESHVEEGTAIPITDDILYAFRTAEGLRPFLANLRQTYVYGEEKKAANNTLRENFNPDEPVNVSRAKASFLLEFPPVVKQEQKVRKINKSLPLRSLSNASTTVDFEGFQGPAEEETILRHYPEFKLVLDFIKNPHLDHKRVRSILQVRQQSAKAVSEVYKLASDFLLAHNKPNIFHSQCVLFLKDMLLQRQLGASPALHYASRLEGCGLELEDKVRAAYYNFLRQLVAAVTSESQATQSDEVKAAFSCIQNILLHLLDIDWSPSDWQFVADIKAPSLLINAARTSGNVTLRDSTAGDNLSYAQQLKAYKQCEDWMKECEGDDAFNTWFSNISCFPDKEERRARHMFVARFCDRLDIQVACDGCEVQLLGQRYRCLVCEDFDFCYNCCQGGAKPDVHTDDHPLVHLMYKCDGCHGLIVGTRYHCNVCEDFDLCYGCQHTGHYPSNHNEFHDSTEIMMRVLYTGSQYSAQLNNYTHLHSWLQFTFLTLSLAQAIYDQQSRGTLTTSQEEVGKELLKSCVELAMDSLEFTCSSDEEGDGTMSIHERVFAEQSQERMLGLLAAMLPAEKGSDNSFSAAMALLSIDKFLPLLFTIAQKGSGHYVPTQHLAMGLMGQLLPSITPEVSDMALESVNPLSTPEPPDSWEERADDSPKDTKASSDDKKDTDEISTKDEKEKENAITKESEGKEGRKEEEDVMEVKSLGEKEEDFVEVKSLGEKGKRAGSQEVQKSKKIKLTRADSIASSDVDGTRTIKFLFSFGASCLEKSRLEWAALLPTMLQKLCRHPGWKASITRQISHSIERLPEDSSLRSVFALFVVAGFPEVLGHGSTASYLDGNRELTDVLILKHFFEKGRVCVVDVKTRKMKHVPEYQLQLSGSGGQVLDGERFLAFTDIARIIMLQLKDGTCAQLSVENLWVLYLVLKAMLASLKVNYSQLLNSDLLPLLVHLAGQPTKLSKRWLLKDLEILSIKLYTRGKAKTSGITQLPSVPLGMGAVVGPEHKEPLPAKLPRSRNSFSSESSDSSDVVLNDALLNMGSDITSNSDDSESWHSYLTADSLPQSLPLEAYGIDVDEEGEGGGEDHGEGNSNDPMGGLDDKAKACLQATHEAILAPVSILRAMYEKCNKNIQDLVEEVQKCFQGEELIVSEEIKQLAKRWEPKPPPEVRDPTEYKTMDAGAFTYTPILSMPREQDDNYAVPELSQHAPILVANSEAELRESFRKHQRTKSGELLKKELEKHGKSASRNYLHVINNALAVMCARQVLAALLADWPASGDHVISTNTFGCKEHSQLVSILDLLQRVEEKDVFLKVVENVVHHCEDGLLAPLCLAACSFMQVTVMLPKTLESKHNYESNTTEQGSITLPGATHLSIKFDERCCTESCCDTLQISSNSTFKHDVHSFTGPYGCANWVDFDLPGDTLFYKFTSDDSSSTEWGYKLTVTGNKLGRFETGYVILNTVLAKPKFAQQVPLQELWEWLVQVARKQVGQSRLKAVQLLLRILASIPGPSQTETPPQASSAPTTTDPPPPPSPEDQTSNAPPPSASTPPPPRPPVDLTRLKPLWLLLDLMNCRLSADCSPQSLAAAHRALMELFLMVENMVREWDMVEEYVLAMCNDEAIKRAVVQGATNIKCIQLALDKSSSAGVKEPATAVTETEPAGAASRGGSTNNNGNNNNNARRPEVDAVPRMNSVLFSHLFR